MTTVYYSDNHTGKLRLIKRIIIESVEFQFRDCYSLESNIVGLLDSARQVIVRIAHVSNIWFVIQVASCPGASCFCSDRGAVLRS